MSLSSTTAARTSSALERTKTLLSVPTLSVLRVRSLTVVPRETSCARALSPTKPNVTNNNASGRTRAPAFAKLFRDTFIAAPLEFRFQKFSPANNHQRTHAHLNDKSDAALQARD